MAELKVPNLCGATAEFNAIQDKFESLISDAVDSLESEASALAASATSAFNDLESDLRSLIPELPALPDTNLQAQLTSLSGLIPGSAQHKTLLADITTKFDSALTTSGFSLDTLVSDAKSAITGGTDLCSAVPNFTVPAAGGNAVEKSIETQADSVISVTQMTDKHPVRMKRITDDDLIEDFCSEYPEGDAGRRQDLEPCYIRNGGIYSMKRDTLINERTRHGKISRPYVMEDKYSVNIDNEMDLK